MTTTSTSTTSFTSTDTTMTYINTDRRRNTKNAWSRETEHCASCVQSHLIRHVFHYQMYKQISTFAVMTGNERPFTRRIVSQTFRSSARSSNATSMGDNEQKIRDGGEGGRRRVGGERWSE